MMVSIVVPIFDEKPIISAFHDAVRSVMQADRCEWEVIYVNDGSTDGSSDELLRIQREDRHVTVIELSRNWGHQAALTAGLTAANGSAVILMDGDFQDPPSVIPEMLAAWRDGAQVVIAERRSRDEVGLRRFLFPAFYKALAFLSDYPIPLNAGIFGLLDRHAASAVLSLSETNRYLPGLRAWVGFQTRIVHYDRQTRAAGKPKQTFGRLLKYGLDAVFSFSYKPLRLSLLAGILSAAVALILVGVFVTCRLMGVGLFGLPVVVSYTSTIVSILFLGGVQLFCVGVLGEYVGRIYDEVKHRPLFVVRRQYSPQSHARVAAATSRDGFVAGNVQSSTVLDLTGDRAHLVNEVAS